MSEVGDLGRSAELGICSDVPVEQPNAGFAPQNHLKERRPLSAQAVKALCRRHGIQLKKSLGQHFVIDPQIIEQTVQSANVSPGERVLEIGPGFGFLTRSLADAGAKVLAVETDRALEPVLTEMLTEYLRTGQVSLVWQDATTADWGELLSEIPADQPSPTSLPPAWKLVANLPYNIATRLILEILENTPAITEMTTMVQLEVAERLAAVPGSSSYAIPSVKLAWWGRAKILQIIPPSAFFPTPKVTSAIIKISRQEAVRPLQYEVLFRIVEQAFRQRRKMLKNSLQGIISSEIFEQAGIAETDRPGNLDLEAWVRLVAAKQKEGQPSQSKDSSSDDQPARL